MEHDLVVAVRQDLYSLAFVVCTREPFVDVQPSEQSAPVDLEPRRKGTIAIEAFTPREIVRTHWPGPSTACSFHEHHILHSL